MMVPPGLCQSIKCPYPHTGTGVRVRRALEARWGLLEGGADPQARRSLLEVSALPRIGTDPTRGRCVPSSEAEPARGDLEWAALAGRRGHRGVGHACACLSEACLALAFCRF
jgi:hypothetical protein